MHNYSAGLSVFSSFGGVIFVQWFSQGDSNIKKVDDKRALTLVIESMTRQPNIQAI